MEPRDCLGCKKAFHPRGQCPNQKYCSMRGCQRMRKRHWQQQKLKTDSTYRENRKDAQQRWMISHPEYWRQYRAGHPDYGNSGDTIPIFCKFFAIALWFVRGAIGKGSSSGNSTSCHTARREADADHFLRMRTMKGTFHCCLNGARRLA